MMETLTITATVVDPTLIADLCSQTQLTLQECADLGLAKLQALVERINFSKGR